MLATSSCICPSSLKVKDNKLKKTISRLIAEIKMVDLKVKPAWLNDFCDFDLSSIKSLLDSLSDSKLIRNEILALQISDDVLVIDEKRFSAQLSNSIKSLSCEKETEMIPYFVYLDDQSEELGSVEIPATLKENLISLLKDTRNIISSEKLKRIEIDAGELTPTLFGIALGYPVVYISSHNVIQNGHPHPMDLSVTKFQFNLPNEFICKQHSHLDKQIVEYAYSTPANLQEQWKNSLESWKRNVIQECSINKVKYICNHTIVNNLHVIL